MIVIELGIVLGLFLLNGLLAMSELAIVSSRRARLEELVADGSRGARIAVELIDDPSTFLSTVQIGITLVGIIAGAYSGTALADDVGGWLATGTALSAAQAETLGLVLIVPAVTYLSLVLGELAPKRIALVDPERAATRLAPAMRQLARLAGPVVWLLKISTDALVGLLGFGNRDRLTVTEDEVRLMIAEGTRAGVFLPKEREMIDAVLRLADRTVRTVMTPRLEIVWLDEQATVDELADAISGTRLSGVLVCRESVDNPLGIVQPKNLLGPALRGRRIVLADAIVPPLVVPEGLSVLRLLDTFRRSGMDYAVVVDEYGSTEGVVTLADVVASVTGELPAAGGSAEPLTVRRRDGSWLIDGALPVDELEALTGSAGLREEGDFDTVAGWMLARLGRLPGPGDGFDALGGRFEVVDMDEHRIDKVLYTPVRRADT